MKKYIFKNLVFDENDIILDDDVDLEMIVFSEEKSKCK